MKTQSEEIDIVYEYRKALGNGVQLCCSDSYDRNVLSYIPQAIFDANQGCGSPVMYCNQLNGKTILDIGCGVGLDVFIASKLVGEQGKVLGVDPNHESIEFARKYSSTVVNNLRYSKSNLEFKQGRMECLPIADESVDVVISNCVINLSIDKDKVFREIFRVLRPGGYFTISDIFSNVQVPHYIKNDSKLFVQCLGGSMSLQEGLSITRKAGFVGLSKNDYRVYRIVDANYFLSLTFTGFKAAPIKKSQAYFIYKGPFKEVEDELGNRYVRGKATFVEDIKTLNLLELPVYEKYFIKTIDNIFTSDHVSDVFIDDKVSIPCKYMGDFTILIGPFVSAVDDEGHLLNTNELEVCKKTIDLYKNENFEPFLILYNKAREKINASLSHCDSNSCC